ncbi:MAG: YqgE/AlgH family protein [Rhodospirillales bacterium]|jgi:putative transcriptional regulator
MISRPKQAPYLTGQMLIAMPQMGDPRFQRTLIFMCAHSAESAMGLVVNKPFGSITFPDLLEQLNIDPTGAPPDAQVHYGGPVENGRGFVLHTTDYVRDGTMVIDDTFALTATVDILRAICEGTGPRQWRLCLGYAGWGAGQLDAEIQANGWLHCDADEMLAFDRDLDTKWERAIAKIGVSLHLLSAEAGHA